MLLNNCNYVIESMSVFILWFVYYNVNTLTDAVHSLVAVATAALVRVDEVGARLGGWTRTRHALVDICYTHRSMIEPQKKAKHTRLSFM